MAANSIDLAFLSDTYHHIEDAEVYLKSILRALRPGGRLVIIDFDYRQIAGKKGAWLKEHVRSTPDQARAEIESVGFQLSERIDILEENYFYIFTPTAAPDHAAPGGTMRTGPAVPDSGDGVL